MPDAPSRSHQTWTVTCGGKSFSGWSEVEVADHDVPTGRYTPGASKGDKVYAGRAAQGGQHTYTHEFDPTIWRHFNARKGRRVDMAGTTLDEDDRALDSLGSYTGRVKGITASGKDASSGDPTLLTLRVEANGEIVL